MINVGNNWQPFLDFEQNQDYYKKLKTFLKNEYATQTIYPPMHDIFNAFKLTDLTDTKVVILGQDPYHGAGQAMGLAFSVRSGTQCPPSLRNIFKEINSEFGTEIDTKQCDLTRWAEQGVFLLNTCLTVREGQANSHSGNGWEVFTDNAIRCLNDHDIPKVFILWGGNARKKKTLITNENHLVLESAHPSPLSASKGFFDCGHFKAANEFLERKGLEPVVW